MKQNTRMTIVFVLYFRLSNTGKLQLEDYRVELLLDGGFQSLAPTVCKPRKVTGNHIEPAELEDVRFTNDKPQIVFSPIDNRPLNQGDDENFSFRFTPCMEAEKIELTWRIIAKDFSDKGKLVIHLKPNVTRYTNIKPVFRDVEIPEGAERVDDLTPYLQELQEMLKQ